MDDIAIKVDSVSKTFKLPHEKHTSMKSAFINFNKYMKGYETQKVLDNISFEIKKGEFFGIVGRNGSGKSTLLKLLAGIYAPNEGDIKINGKLTPFIELGVGFNPELTGRENVFLNGALLGFSRSEMEDMYDEIVEFAELERFMDQKLKNYSSGMQVRLAFSIAIRADSDILLLDEVLAVGDENFQRKCYNYFSQLKKEAKTVILVSHDMTVVKNYCTSGLLLHDGKDVVIGPISKVAKKYTEINISHLETTAARQQEKEVVDEKRWGNGEAKIIKVWTSYEKKKKKIFRPDQDIEVNIQIEANNKLDQPVIGLTFQDQQGRTVFATNTKEMNQTIGDIEKGETITATFEIENIYTNGTYLISCAIANSDRSTTFSRVEEIQDFGIAGRSMEHSLAHPKHKLTVTSTPGN